MSKIAGCLVLVLLLSACSGLGPAVLDVAKAAYGPGKTDFQSRPLNPSMVYLEVVTPRASALLVLAYRDIAGHGLVETWVSGQGEVLRTQNGLVVGQVGVPDFWANAQLQWQGSTPTQWLVEEAIPHEQFVETGLFEYWSGAPTSVQPSVRKMTHRLEPIAVSPSMLPQTALLRRASLDPNLQWRAWWSVAEGEEQKSQKSQKAHHERLQLVAFDPRTGEAVYGQHCIAKRQCIEYLRRTAQENR